MGLCALLCLDLSCPRCVTRPSCPVGRSPTRRRARTASPLFASLASGYPRLRSLAERGEPCLRDLHVVLRRIEACTDRADHLAIDHDRKASLHLDEAARRHGGDASMIDGVLERLAWLLNNAAVLALPGASSTLAM